MQGRDQRMTARQLAEREGGEERHDRCEKRTRRNPDTSQRVGPGPALSNSSTGAGSQDESDP
jgi:hypothetical protein